MVYTMQLTQVLLRRPSAREATLHRGSFQQFDDDLNSKQDGEALGNSTIPPGSMQTERRRRPKSLSPPQQHTSALPLSQAPTSLRQSRQESLPRPKSCIVNRLGTTEYNSLDCRRQIPVKHIRAIAFPPQMIFCSDSTCFWIGRERDRKNLDE